MIVTLLLGISEIVLSCLLFYLAICAIFEK